MRWLDGHEFEQTPGDSERQGSLLCCSPQGHKESDMTAAEQQQSVVLYREGRIPDGWVAQGVGALGFFPACEQDFIETMSHNLC